MTVGIRRALTTTAAVVSCSAAVVLSASPAQAGTHNKGTASGQAGWCGFGTLSYSPRGMPPVVTTPDATALSGGTLSNTGGYGLTDVHAVLAVAPPFGTTITGGAGAPLLAWRVNGGPWQPVSLSWNAIAGPGGSWRSADLDLGLYLGAHASAAVDLETQFVAASPGGQYVEQLTLTAQTCGSQDLGAGLNFSDFQPAATAATGSAAPKHTAAAPATSRAAATGSTSGDHPRDSAPPRPSATPSSSSAAAKAKPSPSASPLKINFVQVLPSAQSVASTASGNGVLPAGVLAVVAVVFLGGLVCIRAVRRRDAP